MSTDVFRMLICGPSNSGKTNILLHMLYELPEYDKVYLFSKNLHQNRYRALLQDFATRLDPEVGYKVIEAPGDEIIPLEELPVDNQKFVVFDDLVCESNQNAIINYFVNGRHKNYSVIYLTQTFYKVPKNIRDNCSHFCIFAFLPRENKRIADELGVDHQLRDSATDKKYSLFYCDKPQKLMKKKLMKIYTVGYLNSTIDEMGVVQVQVGRQDQKAPLYRKAKRVRQGPPGPNWAPWCPWPNRPSRTSRCGRTGWRPRTDRPKGDRGEKGDKDDKGEKGEKGDKGDKGEKGDKGNSEPEAWKAHVAHKVSEDLKACKGRKAPLA